MSMTSALSNALSGLTAVSRAADVVSNNVSNAMTDGYGAREIELTSSSVGGSGGGVSVVGVTRNTDAVATSARRLADADVALEETRVDFYDSFTNAMGQPDEADSIAGRITGLETALIEAASRPESEARLSAVVNAASDLADQINSAADALMDIRMTADAEINTTVDALQSALDQVVELNVAIQKSSSSGYDVNSLIDQRSLVIDQISEIIPVKTAERDNGMVTVYSTGGSILVDSKAATIEFTAVPTIVPSMTIQGGVLSGLTINGQSVSTDAEGGAISGGKLAGLFEVRDVLAPEVQEKLDAVARDLIERFQTSNTDSTLSATDAGLFTDSGAFFDIANEESLSGRISVNTLVDPDEGGDLWKIRDGLMATTEGEQGDATILNTLTAALQDSRVVASGGFTGSERSAAGLASDYYSLVEVSLLDAESDQAFASATQETYKTVELENGVDTDQQLQNLLIIEQSYSANAKVIQTIDELLTQLVSII